MSQGLKSLTFILMELENPNPYKELRKELRRLHNDLGKLFFKLDLILKQMEEERK